MQPLSGYPCSVPMHIQASLSWFKQHRRAHEVGKENPWERGGEALWGKESGMDLIKAHSTCDSFKKRNKYDH